MRISSFLISKYGFKLLKSDPVNGDTLTLSSWILHVSSGWSGRWDEHECYKLMKGNEEIFNIGYQISTEGYFNKPKIYKPKEIEESISTELEKYICV